MRTLALVAPMWCRPGLSRIEGNFSSSVVGNLLICWPWLMSAVYGHSRNPYTIQQIYALERVQRQAARFVTGDYSSREPGSVTSMLQQLQWDTLEE
jgi:hypothetical protein